MNYQIEKLIKKDWLQVRSIYAESISTGIASFDTKPPNWSEWNSSRLSSCRFVARNGNNVFGWATLSPVYSTWGYVGVAEVSVHVRHEKQRQGIGSDLLKSLLTASEKEKYWTITAEIISENLASLSLHRKCGFREVGYREKLGHRQGVWHDVILMERRSQKTGGNGLPTRKCKWISLWLGIINSFYRVDRIFLI